MITAANESGFTLVELIMAMAVFCFLLLAISLGFIQIIHLYQSGLASRDTQQTTRFGLETVVRDVRSADRVDSQTNTNDSSSDVLCTYGTGSTVASRYYVSGSRQLVKSQFHPVIDPVNGNPICDASSATAVGGTVVLSADGLSIANFTAEVAGGAGKGQVQSVRLTLRVATKTNDLLTDTTGIGNVNCSGGQVGSQYCSTTVITTSVEPRGVN